MQGYIRKAYFVFAYERCSGRRVGCGGGGRGWGVGESVSVGGGGARPAAASVGRERAKERGAAAMVNTSCAVFRCGSTSHKHKGIRFHQFPRDER